MFSLNESNDKNIVCCIKNGKYGDQIVYLNPKDHKQSEDDEYADFDYMKLPDGKFNLCPNTKKERDIISFFGASGSGKSFLIKEYCLNYHKVYPRNYIYIFSRKRDDESLKEVKLDRVKIDYGLILHPIKYEEFANSCVIFDDIDGLEQTTKEQKLIRAEVHNLKNQILELGRSLHITCLITSHIGTKGHETRTLINESHKTVIYPSSGSNYKRLLNFHYGFDKKQIERIINFDSRWVCLCKTYPQIVFTENEILPLKDL